MILAPLLAVAAFALPQVNVSNLPGVQAETIVAASPVDPRVLLAGSNDASLGSFDADAFTSTDGGATWTLTHPFPRTTECAVGDPVTAIADDGRELFGYLTVPCGDRDFEEHVSLYVSTRADPSAAWTPVLVADPTPGSNDKPALIWDTSATSPHHGRAYLAWNQLSRRDASIVISSSDDGGATWSAPAPVNPRSGPGSAGFFVGLALAPDGTLYASWEDVTRQIYVARSTDGGVTFGSSVYVDSTAGLPAASCRFSGTTIPAQARRCVTQNPTLVVAGGRVEVVYAAAGGRGRELDVLARSFDLGLASLGRAVRVHPPDGKVAADQFQPVAAADPRSGLVWVCYYDSRGDRTRRSALFTCTASRDGVHWARPLPVASVRSNETRAPASGFQFGDYQGLAIGADGVAHPLWTDSRDLRRLGEEIYTTALAPSALGY